MENYNETYTKRLLKSLYRKTQISFQQICDLLEIDETQLAANYLCGGNKKTFFEAFPTLYPIDDTAVKTDYEARIIAKFQNTDYFQYCIREVASNERMVVNVANQQQAMDMIKYLIRRANNLINRMEFYGGDCRARLNGLRREKVIIHYSRENREVIYNILTHVEFLSQEPVPPFYHLYTEDIGGGPLFPVGIGQEMSGPPFLQERADNILQYMTGHTFNAQTKDTLYNVTCVKGSETGFVNNLFNAVIANCRPL